MSDNKNDDNPLRRGISEEPDPDIAVSSTEAASLAGSVQTAKTHPRTSSSSDRQIKFERAQKCLENAALVSKRIKEHRKATAELLGKPFEEDDGGDTASEMATTMSERTGYSVATDTSTTLSVQEALNIPGISESLANTLKQKELLMERIKQYKEISKRPMKSAPIRKESSVDIKVDLKKGKENADVNQLINTLKEKENALSIIQVKMKAMETTILDLQEKITEKDQIIDAKNKATTLISDSLSKKEKDSLALLEDTRQQMIKMQENFINMETEWKEEKDRLLKQIEEKDNRIASLEQANTLLEDARFELSLSHSKLLEEIELKDNQIKELQGKVDKLCVESVTIQKITENYKEDPEEEKGSKEISDMVELTKKIELLEQLNCQIRQTNKELENKLTSMNVEGKSSPSGSPSKKPSPVPTRKGGRGAARKSPWSQLSSESIPQDFDKKPNKHEISKLEMVVQSLNKDILDKEYLIAQKDAQINELKFTITHNEKMINELKSQASQVRNVVDAAMCTESVNLVEPQEIKTTNQEGYQLLDVKQLQERLKSAEEHILVLTNEIDAANKNMVKVKSNHKLKLKQLQKTIDNFSKVSDSNAEIVKLNEELHQLSQKVAELEEEKGNLQLHLVDYDSGRLTESDVYKKLVEMENLAETRLKAISVLEAQKFDLVQELHDLQQKYLEIEDKLTDMTHLQSEQVSTEIKSVQLEEQIDQLNGTIKELKLVIENLKLDKEHLEVSMQRLREEKDELAHKLESYIQENIELTDKLEKLSAEKVSSAESIEIVESLTTQEKLELEEYNKGLVENKSQADIPLSSENPGDVQTLVKQIAELNKKIELFTQERQEVMEKMNNLNIENGSLNKRLSELQNSIAILEDNTNLLMKEKEELRILNEELNHRIEELKRERSEIMKESIEVIKPPSSEEPVESVPVADVPHDDKIVGEKGNKGAKTVKQLTKDILKLKNTIKEREAEIGDCQMKILSLEEQQQKYNELLQTISNYDTKIKSLTDENQQLREELNITRQDNESEQKFLQFKQTQEMLQQEIQKLHHDYTSAINTRDSKIKELENLLAEYEKQVYSYGNTLQQKDKEISEYTNQITKLNDVSQKLKSTIELLEEEKAKDPNGELVKSINKQLAAAQKKLSDNEERFKIYEDEKVQLISLKNALENKNKNLESEMKKLQDSFTEKQNCIQELQAQQQKLSEEIANVKLQLKERDEEVHEIKLQLRKESIENEKLRTSLSEKENYSGQFNKQIEDLNTQLQNLSHEKVKLIENCEVAETKNKELMDKLKKYAATLKKKSSMYAELENHLQETQKELEAKNLQLEQLVIQVDTLPALQEKLKFAEDELNRLQSQRVSLEHQKSLDIQHLQGEIKMLEDKLYSTSNDLTKLNDDLNVSQKDLYFAREENLSLKSQLESLNNKLADFEIEQKNNMNFTTKIASLEADIYQKQNQISELVSKLESQEQQLNQVQFGHDAKIQERNVYIESLESEINKYKNRICRLEESICEMEARRQTLERKADQLDTQLQEKQKAYSEYTNQEDHLVNRLVVLMEHDRVVEKQLHEIENENRELQHRTQNLSEENLHLRKSLHDIQEHCNSLVDKASRADHTELELQKSQSQLHELESQFKRISHENQTLFAEKKHQIEEIEMEFNTQIENAIKEKKALSEKYEKMSDHVIQLENKLHEYQDNIATLKINIEELNRVNEELVKKINRDQTQAPDYTAQYIDEINRLNSVLNSKKEELNVFQNKLHFLQNHSAGVVTTYENKIRELNEKLKHSSDYIEQLLQELNVLRNSNDHLITSLEGKDLEIKRLSEERTVSFEMNIPKTEGLVISSTIEPLHGGYKEADVCSIESQIVTELDSDPDVKPTPSKMVEKPSKIADTKSSSGEISEPVMVAKKAYLCHKDNEEISDKVEDPFNSDEGWGLGESEETDVTPGLTHLTDQIQNLKLLNEKLKSELEASNNKLIKAMKKIKELKASNDMLSNELKISKQLSQSSFLDSAMEDELKININDLEKKVEELTSELNKERREKDGLRKQNEIFHNANDKLTEMKENLDNEVELWKFKFKEANDKMSTLQWSSDVKDSPQHKKQVSGVNEEKIREEIIKLEKENDELQTMIDQLTTQNKDLSVQQTNLKVEIDDLHRKIHDLQSTSEKEKATNKQLIELQNAYSELKKTNNELTHKLSQFEFLYNEIMQKHENTSAALLANERENSDLQELNRLVNEELCSLKAKEIEAGSKLNSLVSELEATKSKLLYYEQEQNAKTKDNKDLEYADKYSALEENYQQLESRFEIANRKIVDLEADKKNLTIKLEEYQQTIKELQLKLEHLDTENQQLLSSVAELRSSIASTVDQRGFEIAELWKQHLAQREADFQNTEQELRSQLEASQIKYEQLLESVRSSSQDDSEKLIMMEQATSLQNKIQEKENYIRDLQEKYAEVMNQIDMMRSEIADEKMMYENKLMIQQEEYEKQIIQLTTKTQEHSHGYESTYNALQSELATTKTTNEELERQIQELQIRLEQTETQVRDLSNQLKIKEVEIYQKTSDLTLSLTQRNEEFENLRKQLVEYEKKIEDLSYEKEAELAVMRLKMHDQAEDFDKVQKDSEEEKLSLIQELNAKIIEITNLNRQISDLNKILEEQSKNAEQMQAALESQEIEIVTLKDEISGLLKSAKMDRHVTFSSDTKPGAEVPQKSQEEMTKELLDPVPRAELDLALYMLHQRDVRCEELTMELTQLLEERDTLQLRLSDSLRSCEELKSRCQSSGLDVSLSPGPLAELSTYTVEQEQPVDVHRGQTSRSSSISDPDGDKPKLQAKLSELRTVKQSRDVRLRQDSEQRQLALRLLQRDVAHLPPEARDQLAMAHHSLSRDSQSTSTVLLNWLRGKNTPKVVHM